MGSRSAPLPTRHLHVKTPTMAFSAEELAIHESTLDAFIAKRRPPAEIRDQVDLSYRIEGQSVVIFEIRPRMMQPSEKVEIPIAKTTFVRTQNHWRVFWQRADLKWHGYDPDPTVHKLQDFLRVVEADEYGCFWG